MSPLTPLCLLALIAADPPAAPPPAATPEQARQAAERGLVFLQEDAVKWRNDKMCATCHHGTMTVWALAEAKHDGYAVKPEVFYENVKWTKERLENIDKPRDTREGWKMVNSPAITLSMMALALPDQQALSRDELKRIAGHLLRHQEEDGVWSWSAAPPKNRPPPFFESDEVATLQAMMALAPFVPADPGEKSPEREARERGAGWLAKSPPNDTTQAAALRLLFHVREKAPPEQVAREIDQLLARQNDDGGWGQLDDRASDAYATGQTLYILSLAGLPADRPAIQRGVSFLVATQKPDGSWSIPRRGHPGVTPGPFIVPITYFGAAWGTMGLMRVVPMGMRVAP